MKKRYDRFTACITDIYQSVQKIRMKEMKKYNLRSGHVNCLHLLYESKDGLTSKELSELTELNKAAISRYMSQMQELGFAFPDNEDPHLYRRKWKLSEKGTQAAEHVNARIEAAVDAVGGRLSEEERFVLYESLEKIQDSLKQYLKGEKQ